MGYRGITFFLFTVVLSASSRTTLASFIDDFEDGDARDASPVTWSPIPALSGGTREVIDGDYVLGHDDLAASFVEQSGELTDISIRTQLRIVNGTGWVFPGAFVRGQAPKSNYWGGIRNDGLLAIGESATDGEIMSSRRELQTGFNPLDTDILLQLDVQGGVISLTAWEEGEVKPEEPQLSLADDTLAAGTVGVFMNTGTHTEVAFRYFEVVGNTGPGLLQPGDADMDLDFDQLDLVQVQIAGKYLTGEPATWGEGDWDAAPGGSVDSPPVGDGLFNTLDIIAALTAGHYLNGSYAALKPNGHEGDSQASIRYDAGTGELAVDVAAGTQLTSISIDSATGIFTGEAADNLGGSFDNDTDSNIFKATFGDAFGSISFGKVAQAGLAEDFVRNDLSVTGWILGGRFPADPDLSLEDWLSGGDLRDADLAYIPVPEPTAAALLAMGLLAMVCVARRSLIATRRLPSPSRLREGRTR